MQRDGIQRGDSAGAGQLGVGRKKAKYFCNFFKFIKFNEFLDELKFKKFFAFVR